jgi:gamma-glutamyltranspeptidase / glutathione hydrolase
MHCIYLRQITFIISTAFLIITACTTSTKIPKADPVTATNGMVVSAHPDASRAGIDILKKGGNAVDAAIAVQFALAVTHPAAGNIGGGGFMIYRSAAGEVSALDFREKAPALATETMYQDSAGNVIPNLSINGHLAAGVPGTVDGMVEAHKKYGSLPWKELLQPAVELALNGVVLTAKEADGLNRSKESFIRHNTHLPYLVREEAWKEGDTLKHTALGHTLERIRDLGRAGFYEGPTAGMIVREMQTGKGMISLEDLANYHSVWRDAVTGHYKGYRIISMPPPSSGGIALLQLLKMVEDFNLGKKGWQSPQTVHLMTEVERRVYADRATHLGDPDFYRVPVSSLLDEKYLQARRAGISPDKKTPSSQIQAGMFALNESNETTHFSIVDKAGNAVAITTTLNGGYGSKVIVKEAGFLLNNEMDDFSIKPGVPNMFGLVGGKANAIVPGKRMLSSMTPTIIEKDGKLLMVVGTPGGSTIITSVFQTILNVLEHEMNMQEAVNAKRFHHQWLPDEIVVEEGGFTPETRQALEAKGHVIREIPAIGRVDAILVKKGGVLEGGADPRGDDTALGY